MTKEDMLAELARPQARAPERQHPRLRALAARARCAERERQSALEPERRRAIMRAIMRAVAGGE